MELRILVFTVSFLATRINSERHTQRYYKDFEDTVEELRDLRRAEGVLAREMADEWQDELMFQIRAITTFALEPGVRASSETRFCEEFFDACKEYQRIQAATDKAKNVGPLLVSLQQNLQKANAEWKAAAARFVPISAAFALTPEPERTAWEEAQWRRAHEDVVQAFEIFEKVQTSILETRRGRTTAIQEELRRCKRILSLSCRSPADTPGANAKATSHNASHPNKDKGQETKNLQESGTDRNQSRPAINGTQPDNGRGGASRRGRLFGDNTSEPKPSLVADLRATLKENLREAERGLYAAEDQFDSVRENYDHKLDRFRKDVAAGRYEGTQTEFDLQYYINRRAANRDLAIAEEDHELALENALNVGALDEDQRTSGFQDRSDDGYAESACKRFFEDRLDRARIERWVDSQVPAQQKEGFGEPEEIEAVEKPIEGRLEPRPARESTTLQRETAFSIGAESSFSQRRFASGRRRKRIEGWQKEQEETRRVVYED